MLATATNRYSIQLTRSRAPGRIFVHQPTWKAAIYLLYLTHFALWRMLSVSYNQSWHLLRSYGSKNVMEPEDSPLCSPNKKFRRSLSYGYVL